MGVALEEEAELQLIRDEIKAAKLKLQLIKDNTEIVKGKVVALEHDISPLSKGHADDGSGSKEAKNMTRLVGEEIKLESGEPSLLCCVVVGRDHTIFDPPRLMALVTICLKLRQQDLTAGVSLWMYGNFPQVTDFVGNFGKSQASYQNVTSRD